MTPSVRTAATLPTFIQVGPGMLWTGVNKPVDGAILQVSGQASGTNDQRVYGPMLFTASGTFIGSTIGESTISYKPTFVDIMIETSTAKVEKVLNTEEARVSFSVAELSSANLALAMPIATQSSDTDPYSATQARNIIKVGGLRLVRPECIAFISPNRRIGAEGPFSYVFCGYNAISVDGFDAPFSRGRETVWRLTYEMIADTTRTIGDQLFQWCTRR